MFQTCHFYLVLTKAGSLSLRLSQSVPHHKTDDGGQKIKVLFLAVSDQLYDHVTFLFWVSVFYRWKLRGLNHKNFPEGLRCSYILHRNYCCKQGTNLGQGPNIFIASIKPCFSFTSPAIPFSHFTLPSHSFKTYSSYTFSREAHRALSFI